MTYFVHKGLTDAGRCFPKYQSIKHRTSLSPHAPKCPLKSRDLPISWWRRDKTWTPLPRSKSISSNLREDKHPDDLLIGDDSLVWAAFFSLEKWKETDLILLINPLEQSSLTFDEGKSREGSAASEPHPDSIPSKLTGLVDPTPFARTLKHLEFWGACWRITWLTSINCLRCKVR